MYLDILYEDGSTETIETNYAKVEEDFFSFLIPEGELLIRRSTIVSIIASLTERGEEKETLH